MKKVEFKREFRDRVSALTTIRYPAGWKGSVADEVAKAAKAAKALK